MRKIKHQIFDNLKTKYIASKTIDQICNNYDVVLHIGLPKTGTSALQAFSLANRTQLRSVGFYYPEHGLDNNSISGGHFQLARYLIQGDLLSAKTYLHKCLTEAREYGHCLFLSSESFFNQYEALGELTKGLRVYVIGYFRDPIEAVISGYNQMVKRHLETRTLKDHARRILAIESPKLTGAVFASWQKEFGAENLLVLPYANSTFPEGRIEFSLLDALRISTSDRYKFNCMERRVNARYSRSALELKRLFNHVLTEKYKKLDHRIDVCLQRFSDSLPEEPPTNEMLLGNELYVDLLEKFKESNSLMRRNFLPSSPGNFLKYPPLSKNYPDSFSISILPSLSQVMKEVFTGDWELVEKIRQLTALELKSQKSYSYSLLKLADLMELEGNSKNLTEDMFNEKQLAILVSEKSKEVDILREIALMLARYGKYEQGFTVISRAKQLRPKGAAIIAAHERLERKVINIERSK